MKAKEINIGSGMYIQIDRSYKTKEYVQLIRETADYLSRLQLNNETHIGVIELARSGLAKMAIDAPYLESKFGQLPRFAFIKSELEAICWHLYDVVRYPDPRMDMTYFEVVARLFELADALDPPQVESTEDEDDG